MIPVYRTIGFKISLRLLLLSLPMLAAATLLVTYNERKDVEQLVLDKGRTAALAGAAAYGEILNNGVDSGEVSIDDLISPVYTEIPIPASAKLDGRRFHARFDDYTDHHGIRAVSDRILHSSDEFIYASGMDANGYVPTTNGDLDHADCPTQDSAYNRAHCRAKRRYDDPREPEPLQAARFVSTDPVVVLDYHRDTGEKIWDVVAPIYVKGQRFGVFRVGVVRTRAAARAAELAWALARVLTVAVVLLVLASLLMVRRSMRPLVELAQAGFRLSTDSEGQEIGKPIKSTSKDEIGQMARALDRLRQSLQAAMARISS